MLKDTFFSLSRFVNVCRKDMVESWKTNLLRVAMMFGVMVVLFLWIGYFRYQTKYPDGYDPMVRISIYIFLWMGLICGVLSASFNMEKMKNKTSRLSILMTPATPFEKFFSRWLISTIVYIVVFLILFVLADYARVVVFFWAYPDLTVVPSKLKYILADKGDYALFPFDNKCLLFVLYILIQSFFVLGSSIWPKNSFVKTFVLGFLMLISYALILSGVVELMLGTSYINAPFTATLAYIIGIFFTLFNWVLAYYRFKESEIINRI